MITALRARNMRLRLAQVAFSRRCVLEYMPGQRFTATQVRRSADKARRAPALLRNGVIVHCTHRNRVVYVPVQQ